MENGSIRIIGWDGDNTLWDWLGYAVPAYEAMSEAIAELAGKTVEETVAAMKSFYTSVGSIENEGLVQGLHAAGFFDNVRDFDEAEAIRIASEAFVRVQRENLALYPGIAETIDEINGMGLQQILVSDAPIHKARARLQDVGLLDKISLTFGMPSAKVPRLPRSPRSRPPVHPDMVLDREKPYSSSQLATALAMTQEELAKQLAFIGDSEPKDMGYARRIGCVGIHSLWGMAKPELVERILKFAPTNVAKRHMQVAEKTGPDANSRIFTAKDPREVVKLIFGQWSR